MKQRRPVVASLALVTMFLIAACNQQPAPGAEAPTRAPDAATTQAPAANSAPSPVVEATDPAATGNTSTAVAETVTNPTAANTNASDVERPAANYPQQPPTFSTPTEITNPYFPVSELRQTISIGTSGDETERVELTLLPETKTITWSGNTTEARIIQYISYGDAVLLEVAYDYFAQADSGDVYYLGEDVYNYADGRVVNNSGSWLAGRDGAPPALIVPAEPEVGMVFNPENLPGVAFETDEVVSLEEQATTPSGPINDGVLIREILMDGSIEHKVYAASYGILEERSEDGTVTLVLANRSSTPVREVPEALQTAETKAEAIFDALRAGDWAVVDSTVTALADEWAAYQGQATADGVPDVFQAALSDALAELQQAATAKKEEGTLAAANALSAAVADLYRVYNPSRPPDLGLLDVLARQVALDATAEDTAASGNSLAKLEAIWARVKPFVPENADATVIADFEASLSAQRAASEAGDSAALTTAANSTLDLVDRLEELF